MTDCSENPKLEGPPAYSSIDLATGSSYHHNEPDEAFETGTAHELEIHASSRGSSSLHIKNKDTTLYYLGHYQKIDHPDIVLYAGYDNHGPQLALAKFISDSKDLKIYIGGVKAPTYNDWDVARYAGNGLFRDPSYRFETRSSEAGNKAKYYWKKTSDSKLGASRWSPRDYKLVRESDEQVVAVYAERHLGSSNLKGTIRYRYKMNDFVEMASMMVLLSLLEMSRRHMRAVARAFPDQRAYVR